MFKKLFVYTFCLGIFLTLAQFASAKDSQEILGLRVGMSYEEAVSRLKKIGKKDHDERKQQEIWVLRDDKRFSHVIVAFDREYKKIRFVTAKAREDGRVRYSDVINVKKAVVQDLPNNYKYVLEVPAKGKESGYKIIARGTNKDYLTYFAVEEIEVMKQ